MRQFYVKYKKIIHYLIFGILTTLLNILSYGIAAYWLKCSTWWSTIAAWISSVLFAYVTNRRFVFGSRADTWAEKWKEMVQFFSCRLVTGGLDMGIMILFVDVLGVQDMLVKCAANGIVIVVNYIASKRIVFRKER